MSERKVKVGIFGGTGVYDPGLLSEAKEEKIETPFGSPSDLVTTGIYKDTEVAIIPRHGKKHTVNPSNVNYRANVWAMKQLGVTHILAPSAVGSLKEEVKPGEILFPDQFVDRTRGRKTTFYDKEKVCHISVADPFCKNTRNILVDRAKELGIPHHSSGSLVVIEGPRFSTRAESKIFQSWDASIIGMTTVPECVLAREAEICYQPLSMVTDYDCWKEETVEFSMILKTMKENIEKVKTLLADVIPRLKEVPEDCGCNKALEGAFI